MTRKEIYAASHIKPGMRLVFNYPEEFTSLPEYSAHRGKTVRVLRRCYASEADILWDTTDSREQEQVVDIMFKVRADDGWEGDAWESELVTDDMPWVVRR